jgi:hypothetical protein
VEDTLKIVVGALLGATLVHGFIIMREGRERIRRFRAVVEMIRFEIDAASKEKIWEIHHNSISRLQEHAAHILSDIQCGRQEAFRVNLIKYCKLTSDDLPVFINADEKTLSPQYEAAVEMILTPLANIIEQADGQQRDVWLASKANRKARADSQTN